jgi:hypothetical protein
VDFSPIPGLLLRVLNTNICYRRLMDIFVYSDVLCHYHCVMPITVAARSKA